MDDTNLIDIEFDDTEEMDHHILANCFKEIANESKEDEGCLIKSKKTKREWLEDIVALIVITVVGGMLVYAHYDIMRIVNE